MAKRPRHDRQGTDTLPPAGRYRVTRYGKTRHFAAYAGEYLLAVTLYRKGAEEITARLEEKDRRITELENQLAARSPPVSPPLPASIPEQPPVWSAPQQLPLLAAEDMAAYRIASPRHRTAHAPRRS